MADSALLIIDLQEAILDIPGLKRPAETKAALAVLLPRVGELIAQARAAQIPVVYVQHDGAPGHRLEKGSAGWSIHHTIAPEPGDLIIHKTASDAFHNTDLQAQLQSLGTKHLIVAGCMTQFCVDTTVRRAISLGYRVTLVADGHTTTDFGELTFEQIVRHHSAVLGGFEAVTVKPANDVALN